MSARRKNLIWFFALVIVFSFYLVTLCASAWLSDDAYISFRAAYNLVHGFGLRWNTSERVQAFTNPLWTLLIAALYWAGGNIYLSAMALSLATSIAAAFIYVRWVALTPFMAVIGVSALALSKSFVDYSTSGLENPLIHFFLALFACESIRAADRPRAAGRLWLIAALCAVARLDTIILFAPALVGSLAREKFRTAAKSALLGLCPLIIWEVFALIYYGFPFPNTSYAKLLISGYPLSERMAQGGQYLLESLYRDPLTLTLFLAAVIYPGLFGKTPARYWSWGGALYVLYICAIGGDFMSGRMLSAPFFFAVCAVGCSIRPAGIFQRTALILALLVFSLRSDIASLGTGILPDPNPQNGIWDERANYYYATTLLRGLPSSRLPDHDWREQGEAARESGESVVEWGREGPQGYNAGAGYFGYFAGPKVHILDPHALGDALLARIPAARSDAWAPGHAPRVVPDGYFESLKSGKNLIKDESLARYYDKLRVLTVGPLWSRDRFIEIIKFNVGVYDPLIEHYLIKSDRSAN